MELVAKAAVICVVVALTALLLERDTPELGLLLTLAAVAAVLVYALSFYQQVRDMLTALMDQAGLEAALFAPILKIVAISLIARLGADVCKDSGHTALSSLMDMAGTVGALLAARPLLARAMDLPLGWE